MPSPRLPLPTNVSLGYASWSECDPQVTRAASRGVNVIVWFALALVPDEFGAPQVNGGPDLGCVSQIAAQLRAQNLPTHHLISIGGWNAPHPSPAVPADQWWSALKAYDAAAEAAGLPGGFDGIDWDLEGNDAVSAPSNHFPAEELRLVAAISQLAKADGKLVTLVPAQSYLDATTPAFSLSVLHPARCWHPEFRYAGRNVYAALFALAPADTYDLVSLQLYESWSLANCALAPATYGGHAMPLHTYVDGLVSSMDAGWRVDFGLEPSLGLPNQTVSVPANKLLLGLANGWTGHGGCVAQPCKSLFVPPHTLTAAWPRLAKPPRGLFFWDLADEGSVTGAKPGAPLFLADVFNEVLHTRNVTRAEKRVV